MCHIYKQVLQASKLYYINASISFEPFNTSIILLYIRCLVNTLPLGLFVISNKFEVTLKKTITIQ